VRLYMLYPQRDTENHNFTEHSLHKFK
jgi:hypothetical protein